MLPIGSDAVLPRICGPPGPAVTVSTASGKPDSSRVTVTGCPSRLTVPACARPAVKADANSTHAINGGLGRIIGTVPGRAKLTRPTEPPFARSADATSSRQRCLFGRNASPAARHPDCSIMNIGYQAPVAGVVGHARIAGLDFTTPARAKAVTSNEAPIAQR